MSERDDGLAMPEVNGVVVEPKPVVQPQSQQSAPYLRATQPIPQPQNRTMAFRIGQFLSEVGDFVQRATAIFDLDKDPPKKDA